VTLVIERPPPRPDEPEVLFREARERRRRRRLVRTAAAMVALLAVVVLLLSLGATPLTPSPTLAVPRDPSGTGGLSSSAIAAAWVDYNGDLHLGSLAAGTQRIVTHAGASPTTPLVALDGMVFWVRPTMH